MALFAAGCVPTQDLDSYRSSGRQNVGDTTGEEPQPPAPDSGLARVHDGGIVPTTRPPPPAVDGGLPAAEGPVAADAQAPLDDAGFFSLDGSSGRDAGAAALNRCFGQALEGPNDSCFLFLATELSWAESRTLCRGIAATWDLASPRTPDESAFLAEHMTVQSWLGATDASGEGDWKWISDGVSFWSGDGTTGQVVSGQYSNWNGNEPNGGNSSNCARAVPPQEAGASRQAPWADLTCTELRGVICEGPLLSP